MLLLQTTSITSAEPCMLLFTSFELEESCELMEEELQLEGKTVGTRTCSCCFLLLLFVLCCFFLKFVVVAVVLLCCLVLLVVVVVFEVVLVDAVVVLPEGALFFLRQP